jgi:hypothetical protein
MNTETKTIRVLTADDHALLRTGIESLVEIEPDMELVAQASTGREAIDQFRRHRPDITLMDLQMPGVWDIPIFKNGALGLWLTPASYGISYVGSRPNYLCNPNLSRSQRRLQRTSA